MTVFWLFLNNVLLTAAVAGQMDHVCSRGYCEYLVIRDGNVMLVDPTPPAPRQVVLGRYLGMAQQFVPSTEAPVRDLRSTRGWHIVISSFLDHKEANVGNRIRFFAPGRRLQKTDDELMQVEQAELGRPFAGEDEIFAITTNEEHEYNSETVIWFLPERGIPKRLLDVPGSLDKFGRDGGGHEPGVWILRETYDGVNAATKGSEREFWKWDSERKILERKR